MNIINNTNKRLPQTASLTHLQVLHDLSSLRANTVLSRHAGLANQFGQARSARSQRVLVLRATLGTSKMGGDGDTSAIVKEIFDSRD